MTQDPLSVRRRTFLAMVGAGSTVIAGCSSIRGWRTDSVNRSSEDQPSNEATMNSTQVYRIARRYYIGPKRDRPPANEANGTMWEVTDPDSVSATQRTFSDGERWIPLPAQPVAQPSRTPGEHYLTPEDGFAGIQDLIDRMDGNVVIHLAPGTYAGSELTLTHGVVMMGAGRNATTLKLEDGANTDLLTTSNLPEENVMECSFRDISFDGNKANNRMGNTVYGAFWNSRFVDCEFHSAPENGVWLAGSVASTDDNQFRGCQFIDNRGAALRGGANKDSHPAVGVVRVDTNWFGHNGGPAIAARGNSWKISNSKLYDNALNGGETIEFDRCSYSSVAGCDIYSERSDRDLVAVSASKGVNSVGNQLKNNDFRGGYRSAVRCHAEESEIIALQAHGNTIQSDGNAVNGIVARKAGMGSFAGCSFKNNTFVGSMTGRPVSLPAGWVEAGTINAS